MPWVRSTWRSNSGTSPSVSVGHTISRLTRRWNRSDGSVITKRRHNILQSCWRRPKQVVDLIFLLTRLAQVGARTVAPQAHAAMVEPLDTIAHAVREIVPRRNTLRTPERTPPPGHSRTRSRKA